MEETLAHYEQRKGMLSEKTQKLYWRWIDDYFYFDKTASIDSVNQDAVNRFQALLERKGFNKKSISQMKSAVSFFYK